jgi:AcrR family transcriptional regulator
MSEAMEQLPRGRHKLSRDTVKASQRERLLRAMLELVAEQGYEATTVPQVVARARVSRNAFYDFFADKVACFLALCDELADEMLEEIRVADLPPAEALREGMRRYLRWWADRPAFARTYLLELPTAGTPAVEQRRRQYARFEEIFALLGADELQARAITFMITELITDEVREGRLAALPDRADDFVALVQRLL